MKNIFGIIKRSSILYPNKIFLKDINKEFNFTYKNTLEFIYKLNNYFFFNKIKKKEKIIVIFDNSVLLSLLFLGITSTNRVFVPVNPDIGKYEFLNIFKTSGAKSPYSPLQPYILPKGFSLCKSKSFRLSPLPIQNIITCCPL